MSLTEIQKQVLNILKEFRTPYDYVAGGAALNCSWPRLSDDLDIFRDGENRLPGNVNEEIEALRKAGFICQIEDFDNFGVNVIVRKDGDDTNIQWANDPETSQRFFAAQEDEEFGFRLHQADNAVNKVLCASSRRDSPRDAIDLMTVAEEYAPLGPLIWAASAKINLGQSKTPIEILFNLNEIIFSYGEEEIIAVRMRGEKVTRSQLREVLKPALKAATEYCENIAPSNYLSQLFVDQAETPVEATKSDLEEGRYRAETIKMFEPLPQFN